MTYTVTIYNIVPKIFDKLNTYRNKKMQQAKECYHRYEKGHKPYPDLKHEDISSFNAKFFDNLS